tara:strand:- start:676 stop:972 length:297 start_codon:yes stop_codon:yes gene_type:complete
MHIKCPKCETVFKLSADAVKIKSLNLKCSICGNAWNIDKNILLSNAKESGNKNSVFIALLVIILAFSLSYFTIKENPYIAKYYLSNIIEFFEELVPIK